MKNITFYLLIPILFIASCVPQDIGSLKERAITALSEDNYDEAVLLLKTALNLEPSNAELKSHLSMKAKSLLLDRIQKFNLFGAT